MLQQVLITLNTISAWTSAMKPVRAGPLLVLLQAWLSVLLLAPLLLQLVEAPAMLEPSCDAADVARSGSSASKPERVSCRTAAVLTALLLFELVSWRLVAAVSMMEMLFSKLKAGFANCGCGSCSAAAVAEASAASTYKHAQQERTCGVITRV